ncbi:MAG: hypothetical protein AAF596_04920, partial [Planctomycetota bacterium]
MRGPQPTPLALYSCDPGPRIAPATRPTPGVADPIAFDGRRASRRALLLGVDCLLHQRGVGEPSWSGRVPGDAGSRTRLLLLLIALDLQETDRAERLADRLMTEQLPDGGWPSRGGGASELSTTALAYLAIKLLRGDAAWPVLRPARRAVIQRGGLAGVSDDVNAWLAFFGQAEPRPVAADSPWAEAMGADRGQLLDNVVCLRELRTIAAKSETDPAESDLSDADRLIWRRLSLESTGDAAEIEQVEREIERLILDDAESGEIDLASSFLEVAETAVAVEATIAAGHGEEVTQSVRWLADQSTAVADGDDLQAAAAVLRALVAWGRPLVEECGADSLPPRLRIVEGDGSESDVAEETSAVARPEAVDLLVRSLVARPSDEGGGGAAETTAAVVGSRARRDRETTGPADQAVARGVQWLHTKQQADGSWASASGGGVSVTARVVSALAAAGRQSDREALL